MKKTNISKIFKDKSLPFVEARYMVDSTVHYGEHFHDTLSIGAIEDGQVLFTHKHKEMILKPNSLVIINPDVIHSCNPIKNEARTYHMIYLDIKWCKSIQKTIFGDIDCFIDFKDVIIENKNLFDSFLELNSILIDNTIFYMQKEEYLYSFIFDLFSNYYNYEKSIDEKPSKHSHKIQEAQKYIIDNLNSNITIENISNKLGISQFYFIKIFKQYTNITPYNYMLNHKILKAKELLMLDTNISQISFELGFSDQSHFIKVFKKYVAVTPSEYKNSIQSQMV